MSSTELCGQVRTYNRQSEGKNRLEVTVFARQVRYEDECSRAYENRVMLEGYICKPPVRRTSPLGREICDLMIAVNRMYKQVRLYPDDSVGQECSLRRQPGGGRQSRTGGTDTEP